MTQHKLFAKDPIDLTVNRDDLICDILRIVEDAVNDAMSEGATSVDLRYVNILDVEHNPDGLKGSIMVNGFK